MLDETPGPWDLERLDTAEGPTPATVARRTQNGKGLSVQLFSP